MGSPVRFRRGLHTKPAAPAGSSSRPVPCPAMGFRAWVPFPCHSGALVPSISRFSSRGDGGVPVGHDVLVAHGRHGGRVAQPVHDLAERAAGGRGQGAGGVAQVMDAKALDPGRLDGRLPDPAVEVAAPQVPALAAEEHVGLRQPAPSPQWLRYRRRRLIGQVWPEPRATASLVARVAWRSKKACVRAAAAVFGG
jgi:hypothetical protein